MAALAIPALRRPDGALKVVHLAHAVAPLRIEAGLLRDANGDVVVRYA